MISIVLKDNVGYLDRKFKQVHHSNLNGFMKIFYKMYCGSNNIINIAPSKETYSDNE